MNTMMNRREFAKTSLLAGTALASGAIAAAPVPPKRIRTAVIGCGSVSGQYLPQPTKSPFVEVVSVCDIRPERAKRQAEKFNIPHYYPHIDKLLAGEASGWLATTQPVKTVETPILTAIQAIHANARRNSVVNS